MPIEPDQPFLERIKRLEGESLRDQPYWGGRGCRHGLRAASARVPSLGELRKQAGLGCGAKTRQGRPCRNRVLYPSGRCKNHGGLNPKNGETPRPV